MNRKLARMKDPDEGYFYYQLKQGVSRKILCMRWAQAWMLYAFSFLESTELRVND